MDGWCLRASDTRLLEMVVVVVVVVVDEHGWHGYEQLEEGV